MSLRTITVRIRRKARSDPKPTAVFSERGVDIFSRGNLAVESATVGGKTATVRLPKVLQESGSEIHLNNGQFFGECELCLLSKSF